MNNYKSTSNLQIIFAWYIVNLQTARKLAKLQKKINKIKFIAEKLPQVAKDELLDKFFRGINTVI